MSLLSFLYLYQRKPLRYLILVIVLHLLLTLHLYNNTHYTPALPLNQAKSVEIYLSQDATPNALQQMTIRGYTRTISDGTITIYQSIPVTIRLSSQYHSIPRGSLVALTITKQEFNGRMWFISANPKSLTLLHTSHYNIWVYRNQIKHTIQNFLKKQLKSSYGLYSAITLGDREFLSARTNRLFRDSGLAHLLALSGLHASALILFLFSLFTWLPLKQRLLLLLPIIMLHAWLTAFLYTLLRAYIMAVIMLTAKMHRRKIKSLDTLSASTIIILLFDWQALYSLSFHLSFLSVLGIILFYMPIYTILLAISQKCRIPNNAISRLIFASLALSFAVELLINPLLLAQFHEIQLFSFLANLFIPMIFTIYVLLATITLIIPLLYPVVSYFEAQMLHLIDFFNIYLISPPWQPVLLLHILLALSLIFWHNREK